MRSLEEMCFCLSLNLFSVEELLCYQSPSQHTARLAPCNTVLGGKLIGKRQAVIAMMGAANHDPEHFPDPDRLDICRQDNRHVAFAWEQSFLLQCTDVEDEGQVAFETVLRCMAGLRLEPRPIIWRENLGLRGLTVLSDTS